MCHKRSIFVVLVMLLVSLALEGCTGMHNYLQFWQSQKSLEKEFKEHPSAEVLRRLQPKDAYLLYGEVAFTNEHKGPVLFVAVTDRFQKREIAAQRILQPPVQFYQAVLPEGDYDLYFFIDSNRNGLFESSEMVARSTGKPVIINQSTTSRDFSLKGPAFSLDVNVPKQSDLTLSAAVKERPYIFTSLDDDFFDAKYGNMGVYDPKDFMSHTQRNFFALEKLDSHKTVVLFVHGANGTPRDFKYLVDALDRKRFQPWFFYYPSGLPLQKLGSYLADVISLIHESQTLEQSGLIVVAHSMGGLVALAGLNDLCIDSKPPYLKGYISFDSPYGGVEAAKMAEHAPAVVPSWRDVATGSDFLEQLHRGSASRTVPFYLFFGYKTGDSSDGAISLQSQLERSVHLNALRSYGFNTTHVGILNDQTSREVFLKTLDVLNRQ